MYHYWGFGLQIESEIEFPELLPITFAQADLTIRIGTTPQQLSGEDVVQRVRAAISPDEYLLEVLNVAIYYALKGKEIIVQPLPGADEKSIRLFLLSNALAAILHQRDMIPFHASAVYHQDGLILFCGRSGAGKSTLSTALQLKGHQLFSDDVCVLKQENGKLLAYASYPMTKLWEDSFSKLGLEAAARDNQIRPNFAKYSRYYHQDFDIKPYPVKQVFVIDPDEPVKTATLKKLNPIAGFTELQKNTYRNVQMNAMKKRKIHFSMISSLASTAKVYKINRPEKMNSVDEMISLIESCL